MMRNMFKTKILWITSLTALFNFDCPQFIYRSPLIVSVSVKVFLVWNILVSPKLVPNALSCFNLVCKGQNKNAR